MNTTQAIIFLPTAAAAIVDFNGERVGLVHACDPATMKPLCRVKAASILDDLCLAKERTTCAACEAKMNALKNKGVMFAVQA